MGNASSYNISVSASYSVCEHTFTWMTVGDLTDGTNYTVSVTAINCAGSSNSSSVIACTFLDGSSHYCVVCCSTNPSVPPDSSVYNISTTRGTEVTVSLQGLTSGQMYYCKAAATNTNSNNCTGPVVGGVKVFMAT